jgi:hypothetical protein
LVDGFGEVGAGGLGGVVVDEVAEVDGELEVGYGGEVVGEVVEVVCGVVGWFLVVDADVGVGECCEAEVWGGWCGGLWCGCGGGEGEWWAEEDGQAEDAVDWCWVHFPSRFWVGTMGGLAISIFQ